MIKCFFFFNFRDSPQTGAVELAIVVSVGIVCPKLFKASIGNIMEYFTELALDKLPVGFEIDKLGQSLELVLQSRLKDFGKLAYQLILLLEKATSSKNTAVSSEAKRLYNLLLSEVSLFS